MEEELDTELKHIQNLEGLRLFCHFTEEPGEQILEEGLFMEQPNWNTTMLEVQKEERKDLNDFIFSQVNEYSPINWKHTAIIVGVPEEYDYHFVEKSDSYGVGLSTMPYVVAPRYLMCSIDLDNKTISYNEESIGYEDYLMEQYEPNSMNK